MKERGVSKFFVLGFILFFVLIGVLIFFWLIGGDDLDYDSSVELRIKNVSSVGENLYVSVEKGESKEDITGVRFEIVDVYGNVEVVEENVTWDDLTEMDFLVLENVNISEVSKVKISPKYGKGGKVGDVSDEYDVSKGRGNSGKKGSSDDSVGDTGDDSDSSSGASSGGGGGGSSSGDSSDTSDSGVVENETSSEEERDDSWWDSVGDDEPLPVTGNIWYARPYRVGGYGLGDGSSYENAWNGLTDYPKTTKSVVWGEGGVEAGDTLYVCGTHIYNMTNPLQSFVSQGNINMIGGNGEDSRVVVRGDCPEDKGTLWGAYIPNFAEWTNEDNGVWSTILIGTHNSDWYFEVTSTSYPNSFIVLDKESSLNGVVGNPGSHYSADYKGGSVLYVHTTDGSKPNGQILFPSYGYEFVVGSNSHITFYDLVERNFQRIVGYNPSSPPTHITWNKCDLSYGAHSIIWMFNGMDYMKVLNSELSWAGNGIYTISTPTMGDMNTAASYYEFRGNYIHDMGVRPYNYNSDAHGVGIQGGHGGLIEGNIFENCGTGVTLYTYTGQELKDVVIKNNVAKNLHQLGGAGSHGFESQTNNNNLADVSGIVISNNIVMNSDTGIRLQFNDNQNVFNNVLYHNRLGFESGRSITTIDVSGVAFTPSGTDNIVGQTSGATANVGDSRIESDNTGMITFDSISGTFVKGEDLYIEGTYFAKAASANYGRAAYATLKNNIFLDNTESHIRWATGAKVYDFNSDNNIFWPADEDLLYVSYLGPGVNLDEWQDLSYLDCVFDPNSIGADPKFVNAAAGDFHLQAGSPAIDAGANVGISKDANGNPVPQGSAPDIGAFEY